MRGPYERTAILREVRFHPFAEEDLDRIDDFVAMRSPTGARRLAEQLERAIERLSGFQTAAGRGTTSLPGSGPSPSITHSSLPTGSIPVIS